MIRTATAAVNASRRHRRRPSDHQGVDRGDEDDDRDEHRGHPVRQPLDRRLAPTARPSPSDRSGRVWCRSRPAVALMTSRPPALTVAPVTASPGADLDRNRLTGDKGRVDRRASVLDHAVGSRSSRPGARRTGHRRRADRSDRVARSSRRPPGPTRPSRRGPGARPALRPSGASRGPRRTDPARMNTVTADCDLQVDLVDAASLARSRTRTPSSSRGRLRHPRTARSSDHPYAASVPIEMSVSIVAAPWRRFCHAAWWNGNAPQTTTGEVSVRLSHCQLSNCSAGIIDMATTGVASAVQMITRRRSDSRDAASEGRVVRDVRCRGGHRRRAPSSGARARRRSHR